MQKVQISAKIYLWIKNSVISRICLHHHSKNEQSCSKLLSNIILTDG